EALRPSRAALSNFSIFQADSVFFSHGRIRQNLQEIHDVPYLDGAHSGGLLRILFAEGGHAGAVDAGVDSPKEIDRPPPAAINSGGDIGRSHYRAPVVILERRLPAVVHVATDASGVALFAEQVPAAHNRRSEFLRTGRGRRFGLNETLLSVAPTIG